MGGALLIDLFKASSETHHIFWFLEIHRFVEQLYGELFPAAGILLDLLGHGLSHLPSEFLITPGATGAAQHSEFTRQASLLEQLEQRRHQLAMGEVAAGTKDDQALRCDDTLMTESNPKRIGDRGDHGALRLLPKV